MCWAAICAAAAGSATSRSCSPQNFANVSGAEALVAIPSGMHTVLVAPGAKWNLFRSALLTVNVLVSLNDNGLRTRLTPVVGIDWGF